MKIKRLMSTFSEAEGQTEAKKLGSRQSGKTKAFLFQTEGSPVHLAGHKLMAFP